MPIPVTTSLQMKTRAMPAHRSEPGPREVVMEKSVPGDLTQDWTGDLTHPVGSSLRWPVTDCCTITTSPTPDSDMERRCEGERRGGVERRLLTGYGKPPRRTPVKLAEYDRANVPTKICRANTCPVSHELSKLPRVPSRPCKGTERHHGRLPENEQQPHKEQISCSSTGATRTPPPTLGTYITGRRKKSSDKKSPKYSGAGAGEIDRCCCCFFALFAKKPTQRGKKKYQTPVISRGASSASRRC